MAMMTDKFRDKTKDALVEKLVQYICTKVPNFSSKEHSDASFSGLGLDSASHVEMTAIIEDYLQVNIDPSVAFDYPTINSLVSYLQKNFIEATDVEEKR
ncbi:acyl carrier protein [Nostocales cyanobacterium LEGE 12452]|nr:acyl carrier protein [Nostocales cyanobacterium LEGE 12452]